VATRRNIGSTGASDVALPDLAATLPESLTVSIDLPPVAPSTRADEAVAPINGVEITPIFADGSGPATRSIDIITDPVQLAEQDLIVDEAPVIVPLPDDEERDDPSPTRRERLRGDTPRTAETASMRPSPRWQLTASSLRWRAGCAVCAGSRRSPRSR